MKLTDKQSRYLRHIAKHGETSEHRIARQLENKGLVIVLHKRERSEWGRSVATLSVCCLTAKGEDYLSRNK